MIDINDYKCVERDISTTIANIEMIMMGMLPDDHRRTQWQLVKDELHDAKNQLSKVEL